MLPRLQMYRRPEFFSSKTRSMMHNFSSENKITWYSVYKLNLVPYWPKIDTNFRKHPFFPIMGRNFSYFSLDNLPHFSNAAFLSWLYFPSSTRMHLRSFLVLFFWWLTGGIKTQPPANLLLFQEGQFQNHPPFLLCFYCLLPPDPALTFADKPFQDLRHATLTLADISQE